MIAKPMKTLELHYPMIQVLIISVIGTERTATKVNKGSVVLKLVIKIINTYLPYM